MELRSKLREGFDERARVKGIYDAVSTAGAERFRFASPSLIDVFIAYCGEFDCSVGCCSATRVGSK